MVDVYSDWSGPCNAMTNFLKKMKLEVNNDLLSYAMAKADAIPQLAIFRGHCKPIWLFISSGEPQTLDQKAFCKIHANTLFLLQNTVTVKS